MYIEIKKSKVNKKVFVIAMGIISFYLIITNFVNIISFIALGLLAESCLALYFIYRFSEANPWS